MKSVFKYNDEIINDVKQLAKVSGVKVGVLKNLIKKNNTAALELRGITIVEIEETKEEIAATPNKSGKNKHMILKNTQTGVHYFNEPLTATFDFGDREVNFIKGQTRDEEVNFKVNKEEQIFFNDELLDDVYLCFNHGGKVKFMNGYLYLPIDKTDEDVSDMAAKEKVYDTTIEWYIDWERFSGEY